MANGIVADSTARHQALLEISESIVVHQQISTLVADLATCLRRIVRFDGITMTLYNPENRTIRLLLVNTLHDLRIEPGKVFPVEATPAIHVLETGRPVYMPDLAGDSTFPAVHDLMRSFGLRSYVILPMTTARRPFLGGLNFACFEPNAYTPEDIHFMQQVARQVGVAVENALNYEAAASLQQELARERDHLRLLLEVNNAAISHLDSASLFRALSTSLRSTLGVDFVSLALFDPEAKQLRRKLLDLPEGQAMDAAILPAQSPPGVAFQTRKAVAISRDQFHTLPDETAKFLLDQGVQHACSVPLVSRGRVLGTVNMATRRTTPVSETDLQLLTEVAGQIAIAIDNALSYERIEQLNARLAEEKLYLEDEIRTQFRFEDIIGRSPALMHVLQQVETVAPSDSAVVISGETGTGKELVARAIHDLSARRTGTFVKLNCAAIPTGLLESELFGHEKGAFTGAIARRVGRFELAHGGTLFLDEIGEIPLELQPKLLRVLQEREFERLGSSRTIKVDVRLVAATNRNLLEMVRERRFRDDLYYRLNVFPIYVPPLRQRREDIPLLVRHFAQQFARRMRKEITSVPADSMEALSRYSWPGNIRELQNLIERAVIVSKSTVLRVPVEELRDVPADCSNEAVTLEDAEREHILEALRATKWTLSGPGGAAARLGMKRSTLQFRMKKLGIERPR